MEGGTATAQQDSSPSPASSQPANSGQHCVLRNRQAHMRTQLSCQLNTWKQPQVQQLCLASGKPCTDGLPLNSQHLLFSASYRLLPLSYNPSFEGLASVAKQIEAVNYGSKGH